MGLRLHYCEEYKVRHSQDTIGNYNAETINYLFDWLDGQYDTSSLWYSSEFIESSDYLEWNKEGVRDAIALLCEMDRVGESWKDIPLKEDKGEGYWSIESWLRKNLCHAEEHSGITPKRVADFLQSALDNGEKEIDYVRFSWI